MSYSVHGEGEASIDKDFEQGQGVREQASHVVTPNFSNPKWRTQDDNVINN